MNKKIISYLVTVAIAMSFVVTVNVASAAALGAASVLP
jgi:hypothetical protein